MKHTTLSKRKRIVYLGISVIVFLVLSPLVAYYASGYRFDEKFEVKKTGGIYVVLEGKGFSIFLNDIKQEVSSIFRRDFFIQNLNAGMYSLRVGKDGYYTWKKDVTVISEKVAEVKPFSLEENSILVEVPKMIEEATDESNAIESATSTDVSTSSDVKNVAKKQKIASSSKKSVENGEYQIVKDLFATSSERLVVNKISASSTKEEPKQVILYRKLALWHRDDGMILSWRGDEENTPLYFCSQESCLKTITIFIGTKVMNADILPNEAFIIFSTEKGVYITETDGRGGRNIQPVVLGEGYDFRIGGDETIYLKKGKMFYKTTISL